MQRARMLSGLTKNRNSGGGDKKQGLPSTIGVNHFSLNLIKRQVIKCKCVPPQAETPTPPPPPQPSYVYSFIKPDNSAAVDVYNQDDTLFTTFPPSGTYVTLIQYTPLGFVNWCAVISASSKSQSLGSVATSATNVFVHITCTGNLTVYNQDGSVFRTVANATATTFVIRYDHAGNAQGIRTMTSVVSSGNNLYMDTDSNSNLYLAGTFKSSASFYNEDGSLFRTLTDSNPATTFLLKYDTNGNGVWATNATNNNSSSASGISVDPTTNNLYWSGTYSSIFTPLVQLNNADGTLFCQIVADNNNNSNGFLAKYTSNGTGVWAVNVGGQVTETQGCSVAKDGNVYLAALASQNVALYEWNVVAPTTLFGFNRGIIVAKYSNAGALQWCTSLGTQSPYECNCNGIVADTNNDVYVFGDFDNQLTLNNSNTSVFANITKSGVGDGVLAKYDATGTGKWWVLGGIGQPASRNASATNANNDVYFQSMYDTSTPVRNGDGSTFRTLSTVGLLDCSLTKYDKNGNAKWATHTGGISNDTELAVGTVR
jgi:hypothetical protein